MHRDAEPSRRVTPRRLLVGLAGALVLVALVRLARYAERAPLARFDDASRLDAPALLFVFQPGDCPSYRGLVERWNRLDGESEVRVVGVGLRLPADSAQRASRLARAGLEFPVRPDLADAAEDLMLRLGYDKTPFTVLVDEDGRPRLALPPAAAPEIQDAFYRQARGLARTLASRREERS